MASPAIFKGRLTKFLTNGGILIPARPQSTDASVVPTPGEIAYDTENENFVVYQDGQWEVIAVFSDLIASNIVNTPYGTITAVNVQTALNELADEKVQKAGDSMSGNLTFASNTGIESTVDASTLNIGTSSYTHNVNIASGSHVSSVNIGTGTGATTINIGGAGDTVNIGGELVYVDVSTLQVEDKDIVVNKNGAAGSGNSAGLHVEEGGVITGFNHVANSRQSWEFIAPANPGAIQLTPSVGAFVTEIKSTVTANRVITLPNTTDTLATQTQIDDLNQRIDDLTTDDVPESATPTNKYFTDTRARTAAVVNSAAGTETDQAPSVSAIVTYVNSEINALDTDDIEEGAVNKYFTDTRAKTAAVVNSTDGSQTDQAPSVSSVKTYVTGQIDALTTDAIEEGATNQYFTVERAQDAAWSALDAGTNGAGGAISVQYDDALNKLALVIGNASTTTRGAALFSPFDFDLDGSQRITIKDGGVNNSQLENSSITLNNTEISLGGSSFVGIVNATKSVSGNLEANTRFFVDTSTGALVLTLPVGAENAYIELKDAKGTWDINNVTITPATGEKIDGLTINESLVCDVREGWVSLAWDVINTRWNVSTTAVVNLTESYATASSPGLVSIENQSFGGVKTFTNGVILSPNTTPVVNPSAGLQVYAKSDNKLYTLTSTGIEQAVGSGGSVLLITQASHGFTSADVGRPLYLNGSTYALAQADTEAKAEVAGLINRIIDGNSFEVCLGGEVSSIGANLVTGAGVETVVFDSYTGQTANGFTSGVGSSRYYGATFIVGTPCDVSKISVYAQTNGTAETGSIYLELYQAIPGIITEEPTGPVLATSTSISLVGLPTSTSRFFDFTFNTPVSIAAGTKYLWLMKGTGIDTNALTALVTTASISDTVTSYYDLLNYGNAPGPYWAQGLDQLFKVTALVSSALTPGEMYFLSASQAGKISTTPPSVVGQISKPVGIARTSSAIDFFNMRGSTVGGTNVYTQIGLTNNAVTTIQNASAYDSVELSGWIYINATAKSRFAIKVQVTKKGDGTNYLVSFQTSGDTPPSGFDVDATAAGLVQITLPSIAGFTSAVVQFNLNGPAVGASLPLQISSNNITWQSDLGYRNLLINARSFNVWQRGTSFSSLAAYTYTADRWLTDGAVTTVARTGSQNNIMQVVTQAGTGIAQRIETAFNGFFAGQTYTISGLVNCSVANLTVTVTYRDGNTFKSTIHTANVSSQLIANQYSYFTTSFTLANAPTDFAGTNCIQVSFTSSVVNTINFQSVQFEAGPVATPFERRPYTTELLLCQRYYELVQLSAAIPSSASTSNLVASASFAATKRNIPQMSLVANNYLYSAIGVTTSTSSYLQNLYGAVAYRPCSNSASQQQFSELVAANAEL